MDDQAVALIVVVVAVLPGIVAFVYLRRRRTEQLRTRYGPEYDRAVKQYGNRAEAELEARAERVEKLHIKPLPPEARDRYAQQWRAVQSQFVEDPAAATNEADRLVGDVMQAKGYPFSEFDQRAADLSVEHGPVVDNYRAAHDITLRHRRGEASTEDLRRAFVHYRALFEALLDARGPEPADVPVRASRRGR